MIRIRCTLLASLLLLIAACSESAAQGWTTWPMRSQDYPAAEIYERPGDAETQVLVVSKTALLEANGNTTTFAAQGDEYDQLAFALGILWIDTLGGDVQRSRSTAGEAVLSGLAMTETGERAFAAVITGRGDDGEVRLLLTRPETFERLGGAQALDPAAKLPPPPAEPAAPATPAGPLAKAPDGQRDAPVGKGRVTPRPEFERDDNGRSLIAGWTTDGAIQRPADDYPGAPRVITADLPPGSVSSRQKALEAVFDAIETKPGRMTGFHEVKALPSIDGADGWLVAGRASRDGVAQRFIALVGTYPGSGQYYTSVFQAPEDVYAAWGGPAFFVQAAGKSVEEILTPELIASVTKTTAEQDIQIADMIITQSVSMLFAQMTSTMGIVSSMQGLSADIATRTDCIMTEGCVPGIDTQGRTIMTFPND